MADWTDDYTRSRTIGVVPYAVDDMIGRSDKVDKVMTTSMSVSGTVVRLPTNPLGRRNYIKVTNEGGVNVAILPASGTALAEGVIVSSGGESWEETTNADLYIVSTGAASTVTVYERASKN